MARKSLMVIGPAIKKLARNFVIPPALEKHNRCIRILAVILIGVVYPKESKNLAMATDGSTDCVRVMTIRSRGIEKYLEYS